MENLVSVIIPARNERYLDKTIWDVLNRADGNVEVIVVLDGADAPRLDGVTYIYNEVSRGMRTAINQGVARARGKYIMKLDAHCMLDCGYDLKLLKYHQPNWVQIPTRKRLIAKMWQVDTSRGDINCMYINRDYMGVANRSQKVDGDIMDIEVFQGSCYFICKDFFNEIGCLDANNFGGSGYEALEIATRVRRNGGRVVRNTTTWYAHARISRRYKVDRSRSRKYINTFMHEG